jgi:hypothetical protein
VPRNGPSRPRNERHQPDRKAAECHEPSIHSSPGRADGNLGADLRVLSRDIAASLQDPAIRTAFASIVAAAVPDLAARDMLARFIAARAATMAVIVNRAVERGEVPPGTDAAEVIQIVMARSTTGCSPPENRLPFRPLALPPACPSARLPFRPLALPPALAALMADLPDHDRAVSARVPVSCQANRCGRRC